MKSLSGSRLRYRTGKVGRRIKHESKTETSFKAVKVNVLDQRLGIMTNSTSPRERLAVLLSHLNHHNPKSRKFTLLHIGEELLKNPETVTRYICDVFPRMLDLLHDDDSDVRKTLIEVSRQLFAALDKNSLLPFMNMILLFIQTGLTSIAMRVRRDAVRFLHHLVSLQDWVLHTSQYSTICDTIHESLIRILAQLESLQWSSNANSHVSIPQPAEKKQKHKRKHEDVDADEEKEPIVNKQTLLGPKILSVRRLFVLDLVSCIGIFQQCTRLLCQKQDLLADLLSGLHALWISHSQVDALMGIISRCWVQVLTQVKTRDDFAKNIYVDTLQVLQDGQLSNAVILNCIEIHIVISAMYNDALDVDEITESNSVILSRLRASSSLHDGLDVVKMVMKYNKRDLVVEVSGWMKEMVMKMESAGSCAECVCQYILDFLPDEESQFVMCLRLIDLLTRLPSSVPSILNLSHSLQFSKGFDIHEAVTTCNRLLCRYEASTEVISRIFDILMNNSFSMIDASLEVISDSTTSSSSPIALSTSLPIYFYSTAAVVDVMRLLESVFEKMIHEAADGDGGASLRLLSVFTFTISDCLLVKSQSGDETSSISVTLDLMLEFAFRNRCLLFSSPAQFVHWLTNLLVPILKLENGRITNIARLITMIIPRDRSEDFISGLFWPNLMALVNPAIANFCSQFSHAFTDLGDELKKKNVKAINWSLITCLSACELRNFFQFVCLVCQKMQSLQFDFPPQVKPCLCSIWSVLVLLHDYTNDELMRQSSSSTLSCLSYYLTCYSLQSSPHGSAKLVQLLSRWSRESSDEWILTDGRGGMLMTVLRYLKSKDGKGNMEIDKAMSALQVVCA